MRILFLFQLLTSALALFGGNTLASLLLLNQYGSSSGRRNCRFIYPRNGGPPRRRCHRDNNDDLFRLALFSALRPPSPSVVPEGPGPTPDPTPGCFPDAMTLERQTKEGGSETISVANLTLGDHVRCLKAPRGPRTAKPELGWCEFVIRGHNANETLLYDQLIFSDKADGGGEERMIAATDNHLLWRSTDKTLKGTVSPAKLAIDNSMFVPIGEINPGDVIVIERNNQWEYRTVTKHRKEYMKGIRNPGFADGGLPVVNGVLATSSVSAYRGGHWGVYFQFNVWFRDDKFADPNTTYRAYRNSTYSAVQKKGAKIDPECLMDRVFEDMDKGIDVAGYDNYDEFSEVYLLPCFEVRLPSLLDLGKRFFEAFN